MRDDREVLRDILEAIERIEEEVGPNQEEFRKNRLIQTWALHHLQIVGEAASRLSKSSRDTYPDVPWQEMIAMRNIIVHRYFGIDLAEIWEAIQHDLPLLKRSIQEMLRKLDV